MTELTVSVAGSVITVTMPGTDYSITYQKVADAQRLVPIKNWLTEDFSSSDIWMFRDRSFVAAVLKAKELGWLT